MFLTTQKGVNKEYEDVSPKMSGNVGDQKLSFLAFPEGPGGFRELRGAGRNHFHLSWYLLVPGVTSYMGCLIRRKTIVFNFL